METLAKRGGISGVGITLRVSHALTELLLHTRPVLVPADAEPSLYFPHLPVQLLGEPLQLFAIWTLKRTNSKLHSR